VLLEGLGKLKKSTSSGTRTGDLLACGIVPQPNTLHRAPILYIVHERKYHDEKFYLDILMDLEVFTARDEKSI
jgi:hypothetical protein